jgi:hypothetical protein
MREQLQNDIDGINNDAKYHMDVKRISGGLYVKEILFSKFR